jgi:ATP-binding cassette subfamily B multidrug efflux pump
LYSHVLNLPLPYHDSKTHGELMSRFTNDVDLIAEAITNSLAAIVNSSLMLVGTVIMMFVLSIPLAMITLLILPIFSFLINRIINQSRKYFRQQQASIGALNGFIEETMEGQQVNQLFNHQTRNMQDFSQYNADFKDKAFHAQTWSGLMIPVMMNLNSLNYAIISTSGAMLCISGALSIGALGAYLNATRQFARPLNEIAMQYTTIQAGLASAERIFEVLNEPIEIDDENTIDADIVNGEVSFEDVHFSYVPNIEVLKGISFYAKKGQKIAFVGSSI